MSPLLIQMTTGELTLTGFTTYYLLKFIQASLIFHTLTTTISTRGAPHWVPICCMVLSEQMFMQSSCVERNKTSGLTAWKLYSALGN